METTGNNALDSLIEKVQGGAGAADTPEAIEAARQAQIEADAGKTAEQLQAEQDALDAKAEATELARLTAKATQLGKSIDEVKALEAIEASTAETARLEAKAKDLGKTVEEVKALEAIEKADADAQAEFDEMNDFEYTLHHDLQALGLELTDDEYDELADLGLDKLDFANQADHGKYVQALTSVLKPRYQEELLNSYKPETLKVLNFMEQGGDIASYAKAKANSYADVEAIAEDTDNHIDLVAKLLVEQSNGSISIERATAIAKLDVADGKGFEKAKDAATKLKELGAAKVQAEEDNATAEAQRIAKGKTDRINRYNTTLDKGELTVNDKTYKLSKEDSIRLKTAKSTIYKSEDGKMYDRFGQPTGSEANAMSLLDVHKYNLGIQGEVLLDLLALNGGYEGLAERTVSTGASSRIKKRGVGEITNSNGRTIRRPDKVETKGKPVGFTHADILGRRISNG